MEKGLYRRIKQRGSVLGVASNIGLKAIQVCLPILFVFFATNSHAQIQFEKGYFIDSAGEKVECLIRNSDWKNNPTNFKYKLSEGSEVRTGDSESVREFAIYDQFKFVNREVNIDRSTGDLKGMSRERRPIFEKEHLFLKVLVEGKANLYYYRHERIVRFFYKTDGSEIEQLVYKHYKISDDKIAENTMFRQQLWNDLTCSSLTLEDFDDLDYSRRPLISIFTAYSECHNTEAVNFDKIRGEKRDRFNLTLRPGLRYTPLQVENMLARRTMDYGTQIGWRIGLEGELILPFNKNKWSLAIEPTYQYFKSDMISISAPELVEREYLTQFEYKSIEIPLSLRHYFFLNDKSKVFVNASYYFDFPMKSSLKSYRMDGVSLLEELHVNSKKSGWGLGAGYKMLDKYSLEIRYQSGRDLFSSHTFWYAGYNQISIIAGYTLF